jgi:hypothetical protein
MPQRFAIVPVREHTSPPAEAIVVGSLDDVMEYIPQSMSRQEAEQIRDAVGQALDYARQVQDYEHSLKEQIQAFSDKCLTSVGARIDSFEKARAQSQRRAEAEQQRRDRQRVQAYLDGLPDIDEPEPLLLDKGDGSELTMLHKPGPVEQTYDPDEPETWPAEDDVGLEGSVITRPTTDPKDLGYPPPPRQVPQPISVSLNSNKE